MNQKAINGHRLLTGITLRNLLSFGPDTPPLELQNLNILIGPNASGKSNLIDAISLMRAAPASSSSNMDFRGVVRLGGGIGEWFWKGGTERTATIDASFDYSGELRHSIQVYDNQGCELLRENIEGYVDGLKVNYSWKRIGRPGVRTWNGTEKTVPSEGGASILSQLRDPFNYPEIMFLAESYEKIRIYRDWTFGRNTNFRAPQRADMRNDRLEEDFSNLGLFLNRLCKTPGTKTSILKGLKDLYSGVTDFHVNVEGGTVQVFFYEGAHSIPATRLSDGTLRYLCLLAILCDPSPPPLICIEEPELGLHPDIIPKLADLLVEASERTQLIVTTHSDILIDAMSDRPESVIVCEKHDGKTEMNRLKKEELKDWLAKYTLGELWTRGEIGGTRW